MVAWGGSSCGNQQEVAPEPSSVELRLCLNDARSLLCFSSIVFYMMVTERRGEERRALLCDPGKVMEGLGGAGGVEVRRGQTGSVLMMKTPVTLIRQQQNQELHHSPAKIQKAALKLARTPQMSELISCRTAALQSPLLIFQHGS